MRVLGLVVVVLAACSSPGTTVCSNGAVCPRGLSCDSVNGGCVTPGQLEACDGRADAEECTVLGSPGVCSGGVCVASICGDGTRAFGEACDDGNQVDGDGCSADCTSSEVCGNGILEAELGEQCDCGETSLNLDCTSLNSDEAGASCRSDCLLHCGDGIVNSEEDCDSTRPAGGCLALGFDRGPIACDSACSFGLAGCADFGVKPNGGPGLLNESIRDLYAAPSGAIFAVGSDGNLSVFDGATWTTSKAEQGTARAFYRVSGSSEDFVLAAGLSNADIYTTRMLYRWDGSTWEPFQQPPIIAIFSSLRSVWVGAPDDYVVSGYFLDTGGNDQYRIWEHDGTGYSEALSVEVWDMVGLGGSDIVGVGSDGLVVWRIAGTWSQETIPQEPDLKAVWASSATDVWAVGAGGAVFHRGESGWSEVVSNISVDLHGIVGTGSDRIYAVGNAGAVIHYDGRGFFPVDSGTAEHQYGVAAVGGDILFGGNNFVTHRVVDAHWGRIEYGGTGFRAPSASGGTTFFSRINRLFRWNGTELEEVAIAPATISDTHALGPDSLLLVASNKLHHYTGGVLTDITPQAGLLLPAVWAVSLDHVFVSMVAPNINNPATVREITPGGTVTHPIQLEDKNDYPIALDGSSAADVYVLSQTGILYHYDGVTWTKDERNFGRSQGVLYVAAQDSVFIGNRDGVWHFDGTAWALMDSEIDQEVVALNGSSPTDVFALTVEKLYHYDGMTWSPVQRPMTILTTLAVTATDVFAHTIFDGELLRLTRPTSW